MFDFKAEVIKLIDQNVEELTKEEIEAMIEVPPNPEMGDYAMPCFKLAKIFRKAPNMIAEEIANRIEATDSFEKIQSEGPYVNFFTNKSSFVADVLNQIYDKRENYGKTQDGEGKRVIVEFSSTNIAKPFHIGHIRSTVRGHVLRNIYDFLGYETVAINHLGDYGTQFGKLIYAYKEWGAKEVVEKNPIPELLKLYVKFHDIAKEQPELDDRGREWFKKLEDGDEEAVELWSWFREVSLKEFNRVYDMLGIDFDSYAGESFYSDKMPAIIEEMEEKGVLTESRGAKIVDLEPYGLTPAVVVKSDGSSIYLTRDIAAAKYRKDTYDFYKNIYVVGGTQKLHFEQLKKILDLMGHEWEQDCIHVPFGQISLEEGRMATREGNVVFLEDVLKTSIEKTKKIIEEKNPDLENKEEVANMVGIGAVVFQELFNTGIKDYVFSWDKTLSFEGETGPYVQYAYARAKSLIRKSGHNITEEIDFSLLKEESAVALVKLMSNFTDTVRSAMDKNEPSIITRYAVAIAQTFNRFYQECPILVCEDEEIKKARLLLVYTMTIVLKSSLNLIGINCPEKM